MNPEGKFGKDVAPVADFVVAQRAVGILAGTADEMDGGGKGRRILRAKPRAHLSVDRPRGCDDPSRIH